MRLGSRLNLLSIISTLLPVAGLGIWTAETRSQNYLDSLTEQQLHLAKSSAFYIDSWLEARKSEILLHLMNNKTEGIREEDEFFMSLMQISSNAQIVGLFDQSGIEVIPHFSLPEMTTEDFIQFREQVQIELSTQNFGFSDSYGTKGSFLFILPISESRILAVEYNLQHIKEALQIQNQDGVQLFLLSNTKGRLAGEFSKYAPELVLRRCHSKDVVDQIHYSTPSNIDVIASCAPIDHVPWYVIVGSNADIYSRFRKEIWKNTIVVSTIACCISLILSALFIRRLTVPMEKLVDAARTISMGGFGQRVFYHRKDEIGDLADAFNMMSLALNQYSIDFQRQAEILSQTNADLLHRVEERTGELERAQEKLIQSARLAAVGEMGAGLAHSLNNPLSAVLGAIQILELSYPDKEIIEMLRSQTKRCKEIVHQWLEASQSLDQSNRSIREEISLRDVVRRSIKTVSTYLQQRDVQIESSHVADFIFWGDPKIIEQAFTQLFYALRPFVAKGTDIRLKSFIQPSLATVQILYRESYLTDDERKAAGMFYWTAIHYFSTHQIEVKEVTDKEYQWTINIPKGRKNYE